MLEFKAIATASTDAHTEVAPLMPQSQGVSAVDLLAAAFIPSGKGIPINSPSGKRIAVATTIRIIVVDPSNMRLTYGVMAPKTPKTHNSTTRRHVAGADTECRAEATRRSQAFDGDEVHRVTVDKFGHVPSDFP